MRSGEPRLGFRGGQLAYETKTCYTVIILYHVNSPLHNYELWPDVEVLMFVIALQNFHTTLS